MDRLKGEGRGNAGTVDAEENQGQVFHRAHSPWKSLCDSHIPTAPAGRGKVENQKQVSHFPTCCFLIKTLFRKEAWRQSLRSRLQAHSSMRKC